MMRLGFNFPNYLLGTGDLWAKVRERARAAEHAGFDSLWVSDHFWQPPVFGPLDSPMFECFTLLGGLAASTERIQLGVMVASATHRHASIIAKAVTTLDVMSAGRAWCGIGAGWFAEEHHAYGIELPPVRERLDRLDDTVRVLRKMFETSPATVAGTHAHVEGALNEPKPVRGSIPILIGGGGEKRTLRLVALHADACNVGGPPAALRHKLDVLRRHCDDVGRDPSAIEVTTMTTLFLTSSAAETSEVRARLGDDIVAACLTGEPDEVTEQAAALHDAGCEHLILNVLALEDDALERAAGALDALR